MGTVKRHVFLFSTDELRDLLEGEDFDNFVAIYEEGDDGARLSVLRANGRNIKIGDKFLAKRPA